MSAGTHRADVPAADRDLTTASSGPVVASAGGTSLTAAAPTSQFTLLGDPGAAACEGDGCALPG